MARCVCIAHSQDVDGLASASIVKAARGAEPVLVDYAELLGAFAALGDDVGELYVCDLGIGADAAGEMERLAKRMAVTYIDHHPLASDLSEGLRGAGVRVVHSTEACAGYLCYRHFEGALPEWAALLAGYASLTDYPTNGKEVTGFLAQLDQKILAFEHSALYYAVAYARNDLGFKHRAVDALSRGIYPHAIPGVLQFAGDMIEYVLRAVREASGRVIYCRNLGFIEVRCGASIVANVLLPIISAPVLLCYELDAKGKNYDVSLRGKGIKCSLGGLASVAAPKVGGIGGGHPMAAGAHIPADSMSSFIEALDRELESGCA
jgi:single-stranded-DNA-specific exonuclease